MIIEKGNESICITAIIEGEFIKRRYIGYSIQDARESFIAECVPVYAEPADVKTDRRIFRQDVESGAWEWTHYSERKNPFARWYGLHPLCALPEGLTRIEESANG